MRKRNTRSLTVCCILYFIVSSTHISKAFSQDQKSFLWRVQSKTSTVYLLGSMHFMRKEAYPLDVKIENAFGKSDALVVEANISDTSKMDVQKLMTRGIYPQDDHLGKHVSRETYEFVKKEAERLGVPMEVINQQRPWYLALTLEGLKLLKLGFDPRYGIDIHFLQQTSGSKRILELEGLDYQIDLLSNLSDKDQELLLLYTLKDLNIVGQEIDSLMQAWRSGDIKGMESIVTKSIAEDKRLVSIYEKLINERNKIMVSNIKGYLGTNETYFVVIGAAHLVGDKGVIQLLREEGCLVEQL